MQKPFLTNDEKIALEIAHKRTRDLKEAYKLNAIILLGEGWTQEQVAVALRLNSETISRYKARYLEAGIKGLLETYYMGSEPLLNKSQSEALAVRLDKAVCLTTQQVRQIVIDLYAVEYSISGVTNLLHRMGYTYKKPKLIPAKGNPVAQEDFVNHFKSFMAKKNPLDEVLFVDAVHAQHNTLASYGWIKKGTEVTIPSNSGRSRMNIHGALNAETHELLAIGGTAAVNAESTIALFMHAESVYPLAPTIHMICDNARYHFSKEVKEWLVTSRINLVPLPTYSPELNMIERVWRIFKKHVCRNRYYEKFSEFQTACMDFFKNQHRYRPEIESVIGEGIDGLFF